MRLGNLTLIRLRYARWVIYPFAAAVALYVWTGGAWSQGEHNGFAIDDPLVPEDQIHQGGPPRDGIPSIDDPQFIAAAEARSLEGDDRVLGLARSGAAKAYPVAILNWHEIVNDRVAGEAVVVSYCPLCGTGVAFAADPAGEPTTFGVSGLLYNSDLLLYDRATESLWTQISGRAIAGPLKGRKLERLALTHATWSDWRARHPDTLVLSRDTGYRRDYDRSPYAGYTDSENLYFPVANVDRRYHPKERVLGVEIDGVHKAYPFTELADTESPLRDHFAGQMLRIEFDVHNRTGRLLDAQGRELPSINAYWFAWAAFHPETRVYKPDE